MIEPQSSASIPSRTLDTGESQFIVVGLNRSVLYAARWLILFGNKVTSAPSLEAAHAATPAPLAIIVAGDTVAPMPCKAGAPTEIYLWDYEVGRPGVGEMACAVSGVSTVIGVRDGPPGVMPARIPEKWAGLFGASLALTLRFAGDRGQAAESHRIDVSAADLLRAFAEQNSGNHAGVPYGWRRNGRTAIEHGGVFPQGFFPCKDGFIAVQARSRPDWRAIITALGSPEWSQDPVFQNPFKLSEDDSRIAPLLDAELMQLTRNELLDRAIATGAPMAPVLSLDEAKSWNVFRPGFLDEAGVPSAPFTVRRDKVAGDKSGGIA